MYAKNVATNARLCVFLIWTIDAHREALLYWHSLYCVTSSEDKCCDYDVKHSVQYRGFYEFALSSVGGNLGIVLQGVSNDSDSDNKIRGVEEKVQGVNDRVRDIDDKLDVVVDGV